MHETNVNKEKINAGIVSLKNIYIGTNVCSNATI